MPAGGLVTAAAISGAIGLAETGYGLYERSKAKKEQENLIKNKPNYNIPPEVQQALNLAKSQAKSDMPGFNDAQDRISGDNASAVKNITKAGLDPTMAISSLSNITSNEMRARADLDVKNAMYKASMQQGLSTQLGKMGDEKEKQWNWNVAGKWNDQMGLAEANKQEGTQEFSQGLNTITGTASSFIGAKMKSDAINPKNPSPTGGEQGTDVTDLAKGSSAMSDFASSLGMAGY
jgi:hypothetical protein